MKRIIAWAVVNDHGKIPGMLEGNQLLIYRTKEAAKAASEPEDTVIKVVIERQSLDV
jgi:hypothetical protein